MTRFDYQKYVKENDKGVMSLDSAAFAKNFAQFDFVYANREVAEGAAQKVGPVSLQEGRRMVEEFSYLNRHHPATIADFAKHYNLELGAKSALDADYENIPKNINRDDDGRPVFTINPYEQHTPGKKIGTKDLPFKTELGLPDLVKSYAGKIISHGPAAYPARGHEVDPSAKPDNYRVQLEVLNYKGEPEIVERWGVTLEDHFKQRNEAGELLYKVGDTVAISNIGAVETILPDQTKATKRLFNFEKLEPEQLQEATKHYKETDANYNRIARHGLGDSGLDAFSKEGADGKKVVSFADMTLEDLNRARGATEEIRPVTMQEKNDFEARKEEFLKEYQDSDKEPKVENFLEKYKEEYPVVKGSQLDNAEVKALSVVPIAEKTLAQDFTLENKDQGDGPRIKTRGNSYKSSFSKQNNRPDREEDNENNPAMRRGGGGGGPTITGTAVIANKIGEGLAYVGRGAKFGAKKLYEIGVDIALGKENDTRNFEQRVRDAASPLVDRIDTQLSQLHNSLNSVSDGWKTYTAQDVARELFSPKVGGHPLPNQILKQQLEKQVVEAFDNRLDDIQKGKDVRVADKEFLDKTNRIYGVDSKQNQDLQKNLDRLLQQSDQALSKVPDDQKQAVKDRTKDYLKQLYGHYAGGEQNLENPKFAQNATRLDALKKGLDQEVTNAYEDRLKAINDGKDVRSADAEFSERMKKAYGIKANDNTLDQSIADTLIEQDKARKEVDDPEYAKQMKDNVNEFKKRFEKQSEIFEIVAQDSAKKEIAKTEPTYNLYEGLERKRTSKENLESLAGGKDKDKNSELASKLGEQLQAVTSFISQALSRVFGGNKPGSGPSGP